MRRLFVLVCGVALMGAAPLFAQGATAQQKTPAKHPPGEQQILPNQFADWKSGGRPPLVFWPRGQGVVPIDPGLTSLSLLAESGVVRVEEHYYEKGNAELAIRAFKLRDPSSACEIYTSLLRPRMVPTNLGQAAAFDKDGVIVQEGSLVLTSTANVSKDDLNALVQAVEARSEKGPLPPIRTYLPAQGRVLGTERYALGPEALKAALAGLGQTDSAGLVNVAGFSSGAEAMVARYAMPGPTRSSGVLLLLEYPTPQLAEQHIHHLDEVLPETVKQGGTGIARKGSLLALVLSASSPEYAKALREDADYETQVTWNEPSATATDPPWSTVLSKIFIGTAVFMVAAVVLGIAFGGVRVLTKIFFPGKVFDRANQMEILQLGLSGKPIDPKDFY
ncbi:MAG TPA: DUF6599 family protein [Candidatus Methylomirabilis sp.]|nr:DUF6599 family protein [Candidatus Methylomirabilis sp.]